MFSACPQCGYLIALVNGALPALCPKCGGSLANASEVPGSVVDTYSIRSRHRKSHKRGPDQRAPDEKQASLNIDPQPRPVATPSPAAPQPPRTRVTSPALPAIEGGARAGGQPLTSPAAGAVPPASASTGTRPVEAAGKLKPAPPAARAVEVTCSARPAGVGLLDALDAPPATAAPAPAPTDSTASHMLRQLRATPSFARRQMEAARANGRNPLRLVVIAMSVVLLLQILLAKREDMAASARWRPLASAVCTVLFCKLPAWHEPRAFTLVQRNVRPHPSSPGVLSVSASFRNDARWAQAWPTLILTLSDVDGREVGTRSFQPGEYRPAGAADTLEPGQTTQVQFDVIEPAPRIVAFNFDFR